MKFLLVTYSSEHSIHSGSLCLPMPKLDAIKSVRCRTEGFVNYDWTVTLTDGRTIDLYSVDSERPLYAVEEDKMEYVVDDAFYDFLLHLPQPPLETDDEGTLELEWTLNYVKGKQVSYSVSIHDVHNYDDNTILDVLTGVTKAMD